MSTSVPDNILGALPAELPLFPLNGVLLLPRGTLPLNVFEPRYLAMVDAARGRREARGGIDVWADLTIARATLGRNEGTFKIGYVGIDTLVGENILIGGLVQVDDFAATVVATVLADGVRETRAPAAAAVSVPPRGAGNTGLRESDRLWPDA